MTQASQPKRIVIVGITEQGERLRPSDWAERVCGSLSSFDNQRICYSPMLQPVIKNGTSCVVLDPQLAEANPETYAMILDFAKSNNLKICSEGG